MVEGKNKTCTSTLQLGTLPTLAKQVEEDDDSTYGTGSDPRENPQQEGRKKAKQRNKKKGARCSPIKAVVERENDQQASSYPVGEFSGGWRQEQPGGNMGNGKSICAISTKGKKGAASKDVWNQSSPAVNGGESSVSGKEGPADAAVSSPSTGYGKVALHVQDQSTDPAEGQTSPPDSDWEVATARHNWKGEEIYPKLNSGPVSSTSGWHMDAGPSFTDGWDDVAGGWESKPSHGQSKNLNPVLARTAGRDQSQAWNFVTEKDTSSRTNDGQLEMLENGSTNPKVHLPVDKGYSQDGKVHVKENSSDAGWETVPRSRGKGPGAKRDSLQSQADRGKSQNTRIQDKDKNARNGAGKQVGLEVNSGKALGTVQAQSLGNASEQEGLSGWGSVRDSDWDCWKGQGQTDPFEDGSHSQTGNSVTPVSRNRNSKQGAKVDAATFVLPSLPPDWSRSSVEQSAGSAGTPTGGIPPQQAASGTDVYDYPASVYSDSQCSDLDDLEDDSDEAFISDDDCDSDATQRSHETLKKLKWFRDFFQDLDNLSKEQLHGHDRQWHCPACKGGVGAIDWFRGLGPLVTHARTMRSRRVRLHRSFVEVLEEELRLRRAGASKGDVGALFGKWKGLHDDTDAQNPLMVWPPMVVIQNTQLELDENETWLGMGNKELLDYFQEYNPLKPRHAYGPQGHRGMSLLVFGESPSGYHDAQRLNKHFKDAKRGRDDWIRPGKLLYHPGGDRKRILYGFMATKEDIDLFNRHNKEKTVVKYEMKRLHEAVLEPMRRMDGQSQQVLYLQTKVEREMEVSRTLKKTVSVVSHNLQLREQELHIMRRRAEDQHLRNKLQQADLEEFFKIERNQLADELNQKEAELQKMREEFQQTHLQQCQQLELQRSNIPKNKHLTMDEKDQQQALMEDEIAKKTQMEGSLRDAHAFEAERVELQQQHHQQRLDFQRQQHEATLTFEKQLKDERAQLLENYQRGTTDMKLPVC